MSDAGRAHVGQLLLAADVDRQVVVAAVLADDLPLVDLLAAADEQDAALLQIVQRVTASPGRVSVETMTPLSRAGNAAAHRLIVVEVVVHDGLAARRVHQPRAAGRSGRAPGS